MSFAKHPVWVAKHPVRAPAALNQYKTKNLLVLKAIVTGCRVERGLGGKLVRSLSVHISQVHCWKDPFIEGLIENPMPDSNLQNNFIKSAYSTAFGIGK